MIKSVPPLVGDTQRWYRTKFQAITHSIAQQHIAYCGPTKNPDAAIIHYHYHCNIYNKEKLFMKYSRRKFTKKFTLHANFAGKNITTSQKKSFLNLLALLSGKNCYVHCIGYEKLGQASCHDTPNA